MLAHAIELARQALFLALCLSLPAMAASAILGTLLGVAGSVLQVNDPSVTHLPRVLVVSLVIFALGGAGAATLVHFTQRLWSAIPTMQR